MADFIVVLLRVAYSFFLLVRWHRRKKSGGGCPGCSCSSCSGCSGCSAEYVDSLIRKAREDK